jgi:hypothetical protein
MADITKHLLASTLTPQHEVQAYTVTLKRSLAANDAAQDDSIQLMTIGQNARINGACTFLKTSATLGASATAKLQRNRDGTRVDLTIATTAGSAGIVSGVTKGCLDLLAGDIIEVLIAGAGQSAAADIEVDMLLQSK